MTLVTAHDGVRLAVTECGSGQTIVLVHGNNFNAASWEYYFAVLSRKGFRCIAYDRRGFGDSDPGAATLTYDLLADDLAAVLEALDVRDVTLVGHSIGCGEVIRYLAPR